MSDARLADPEEALDAARAARRRGDRSDEVRRLDEAAEAFLARGDTFSAAVTSRLVLDLDPAHPATLRRIPELARRQRAELGEVGSPEPPRAEDLARIGEVLDRFYFRAGDADPGTPGAAREVPLPGDHDPELDIEIDEAELEPAGVLAVDRGGNIVPAPPGRPPSSTPSMLPGPAVPTTSADVLVEALGQLSEGTVAALVAQARVLELAEDQELFHQGDPADALYVVAAGTLGVIDEGPPRRGVAKLGPRRVFGEIGILTGQPRSATVAALTPATVIALDHDVVRSLGAQDPSFLAALLKFLRDALVDRLLTTNPLFGGLSARDRAALRGLFRLLEVEAGAVLIQQGAAPEGLFILLAGRAEVVRRLGEEERVLAELGPGDVAGEISLLTRIPPIATVRATTRSLFVRLPTEAFVKIVEARPAAREFVERLAERRMEQAQAILAGARPHLEGHVPGTG